jgi:hypothetical protein
MSAQYIGIYTGSTGAVTTTAGTATTYTGLVLTNPASSPVVINLEAASVAAVVAQTAVLALGFMGGYSATAVTQTTPITPSACGIGYNASYGYGLLASAATLPVTPNILFLLGALETGATTVGMFQNGLIPLRTNNGDTMIQLLPGSFVAFYTSAASVASSLQFSFVWSEQPK